MARQQMNFIREVKEYYSDPELYSLVGNAMDGRSKKCKRINKDYHQLRVENDRERDDILANSDDKLTLLKNRFMINRTKGKNARYITHMGKLQHEQEKHELNRLRDN